MDQHGVMHRSAYKTMHRVNLIPSTEFSHAACNFSRPTPRPGFGARRIRVVPRTATRVCNRLRGRGRDQRNNCEGLNCASRPRSTALVVFCSWRVCGHYDLLGVSLKSSPPPVWHGLACRHTHHARATKLCFSNFPDMMFRLHYGYAHLADKR